jgi:hypothetical protein
MDKDKETQLFFSLVYNFQMQSMIQLGKIKNPITDKSERDLQSAQVSIDILDMLKEKTKGNLSTDELNFLDTTISNLKLNYVDEANKSGQKSDDSEKSEADDKEPKENK